MKAPFDGRLNPWLKSALAWSLVLQVCAIPAGRTGEPPKLSAVLNAADHSIRIDLQGAPGVDYSIEASNDLKVWSPIGGGPAVNGRFSLQQPVPGSPSGRYYRGREGAGTTGETPFPTSVAPVADTNLSVTTLITTNGGSALLYARDGMQFRFIVPTRTLPGAEMVTMTLVTNVNGLPFAQGLVGAVRLEPDRMTLWGAATLEIILPPGMDRRRIASFAATANGSSFHLTPDRVTATSVIIPVTRLGLFGSALASATELVRSANSPSRDSSHSQASRSGLHLVKACFPDRSARAVSYNEYLGDVTQQDSQNLAQALTAARQTLLSGESGDTFDIASVAKAAEERACELLRDDVLPLTAEAKGNCALSRVLLSHSLGIERQRQILGIPDNPTCSSSLDAFPLCEMMANCVKEIKECCENGIRGRNQITALFEIWRQEQLLGLSCLSESEKEEAVDACTPGVWSGTLIFKSSGEKSESDPDRSRSELQKITEEFAGQVTDSVEFGLGESTSANLRVEGHMTSSYEDDLIIVTDNADGCSGFFGYYHKTQAASGPAVFSVLISTGPGRAPMVTVGPIPDPPLVGNHSGHEFERSAALVFRGNAKLCDVRTSSDSDNHPIQISVLGSIFGQPSTVESNRYSGSASLSSFQLKLPGTGTFSWDFTRRKAGE